MLKKEDKSLIISILAVVVSFLLLFTSVLSFINVNLFKFKGAVKVNDSFKSEMTTYIAGTNRFAGCDKAEMQDSSFVCEQSIYFNDPQYKNVRIVAARSNHLDLGSIVDVTFNNTNGYELDYDTKVKTKNFKAIVLDRGRLESQYQLDLFVKTPSAGKKTLGRVGISYKVLRVGYYNGSTTTAKKTTTTKAQELTLNCPSIIQTSVGDFCYTNQADVSMQVSGCKNSEANTFKTTSSDMRKYMKCSNTGTVTVTASKGGVTLTRKIILTNTLGLGIKAQQINVDLNNSDTNVSTYNLKKSDFANDSNRVLKIKYTFIKASGYYYNWFTYKTNDDNGELNYKDICRKITTTPFNYNPTLTIYKESKGRSGIIKVYKNKNDCEKDKNVVTSKKIVYNITDYENTTTNPNFTTTSSKKLEVDATVTPHSGSVKESDGVYKVLKSDLKNGNATTEFKVTPKSNFTYYVRWFTYKNASLNKDDLTYKGLCLKQTKEYVTKPTLSLSTYSNRLGILKVYSKEDACKNDSYGKETTDVIKELKITYKKVNSIPTTTTDNVINVEVETKASYAKKMYDGDYEILKKDVIISKNVATHFKITPQNGKAYYARWFTYKSIYQNKEDITYNKIEGKSCVSLTSSYEPEPSLSVSSSMTGRLGIYKTYSSEDACRSDSYGLNTNDVIREYRVMYEVVSSYTNLKNSDFKKLSYNSDAILKDIGTQVDTVHYDSSYSASFAYGVYILSNGTKKADKVMEDPSKAPTVYGAKRANSSGSTVDDKTYFENIKSSLDKGIPLSAPFVDKYGERHYVLIIGYNKNADNKNYSLDDFYGIDSFYDKDHLNIYSGIKLKEGKIKSQLGYIAYYNKSGKKVNPWTWGNASDAKAYDNPTWPINTITPSSEIKYKSTSNKYLGEVDGYYLIKNYIYNNYEELGYQIGSQEKINNVGQCLQACYAYAVYILTNGESAKTNTNVVPDLSGHKIIGSSKEDVNTKIKQQIDKGYPAVLHVLYNGGQHWLLVVGYKATATDPKKWTDNDVYVVDPYNGYGNHNPLRHGPLDGTGIVYHNYHSDWDIRYMDEIVSSFNSKYNTKYKVNLITN